MTETSHTLHKYVQMSHLDWDARGMLCSWNGRTLVRKYTYSEFERYCHECITPSMYHYMASYVMQNPRDDNVAMAAVNAYYDVPVDIRIEMHHQELVNIEWQCERVNILIDTCEDEDEMHGLMNELGHYTREIHEEELWRV
jgi:hypothetical protein